MESMIIHYSSIVYIDSGFYWIISVSDGCEM